MIRDELFCEIFHFGEEHYKECQTDGENTDNKIRAMNRTALQAIKV